MIELFTFLITLLLFKLPSLYILFISKLTTTHTLGKIVILTLFTYFLLKFKIIRRCFLHSNVIKITVLYLIAQSLSIIHALDIFLFARAYINQLTFITIFLLSIIFISYVPLSPIIIKKFMYISGILCIIVELVFYIQPSLLLPLILKYVQKELLDAYIFNLERNRPTLDLYCEIFLPLFIYDLIDNKKYSLKLFNLFMLISIVITSIGSNFRVHLLALMVSLFASSFFIFKKRSMYLMILTILTITTILTLIVNSFIYKQNITDRLIQTSQRTENYQSYIFRIKSFQLSWELFLSSPITGIGLGNYQIYLNRMKNKISTVSYNEAMDPDNPHNIVAQTIAETGSIGIFSFFIFLAYIFYCGFKLMKYKKKCVLYFFGALVLFSTYMVNPSSTVFTSGWFWLLSGITVGLHSKNRGNILFDSQNKIIEKSKMIGA